MLLSLGLGRTPTCPHLRKLPLVLFSLSAGLFLGLLLSIFLSSEQSFGISHAIAQITFRPA
jgi:hypothetical protein